MTFSPWEGLELLGSAVLLLSHIRFVMVAACAALDVGRLNAEPCLGT